MPRAPRIDFAGALHHVTVRGNHGAPIFADDADRSRLRATLAAALARCSARVVAYCLMSNHFHLVVRTPHAHLSVLMRQVNGGYTQSFHRRHGGTGHLFQGRFHSVLVDGEGYLSSVCRYVERNPVRAGLVLRARDWAWSSHGAHIGQATVPPWLDRDALHGHVLQRDPRHAGDLADACRAWARYVDDADVPSPWPATGVRPEVLGDSAFIARMRPKDAVPAREKRRAGIDPAGVCSVTDRLAAGLSLHEAMWHAHVSGGMTLTAIARELGVSLASVSRMIAWRAREEAR